MERTSSKTPNICSDCNKTFQTTAALLSHKKWAHEAVLDYRCDFCGKQFPKKYNLLRHVETVHSKKKSQAEVKCAICNFCACSKRLMVAHYQTVHDIKILSKSESFDTVEQFLSWKRDLENKTRAQYVTRQVARKLKNGTEIMRYVCHRDGNFVSRGNNLRRIKGQGSNKINCHCPAKMTVTKSKDITVEYIDTHIGHDMELRRMTISEVERKVIAEKIASKIPFQDILDEIRDSVENEQINRIHLINRKDLWNIVNSFNLKQEDVLSKCDNPSVDLWVASMQTSSNTVRFYKSQGIVLEDYPQLEENNFCLIIMNDAQKDILEKYGGDCVCIDGHYGDTFQLYTIMVLDDARQGFPCAFMFTNRGDTLAMEFFFNILKASLGHPVQSVIFMSDLDDSFYNAWCATMSLPQHRLYCSWHVDRAWRTALNKIEGIDEQAMVYKKLKALMLETDQTVFANSLNTFCEELYSDPNTIEFAAYFEEYRENPASWAYCYYMDTGINTNMYFEHTHNFLKNIGVSGKKAKRMETVIHVLMKFTRDKLYDRLNALNNGKVSDKMIELLSRHKEAMSMNDFYIVEEENEWRVQSVQNSDVYTIEKNNVECKCQLYCTDCEACVHAYHCSCMDSSIKWNMCKHIHLVCMYVKNKRSEVEFSVSNLYDCVEVIEITVGGDEETQISVVTEKCFEERKRDALEKVVQIHNMIENEDQLQAFTNKIESLESTIKTLSSNIVTIPEIPNSEPSIKKIKLQDWNLC